MSEFFRLGVGVVITDGAGRVLAFERLGHRESWQFPQGGVDEGESLIEAARRELHEETGIPPDAVSEIAEHPVFLGYELPPAFRKPETKRGQCHKWFLLRLNQDVEIDTSPGAEFGAHRWMSMDELCSKTVEFRRDVYAELARFFAKHIGT